MNNRLVEAALELANDTKEIPKLNALFIRAAREAFKLAVASVATQGGVNDPYRPTQSEIQTANRGHKLDAVKAYKNRTGQSLMDSKRKIEQHMD